MALSNDISGSKSSIAEVCVFFGDFDKDECSRYFKKVRAVKFAKSLSKVEDDGVQGVTTSKNAVQEMSTSEGQLVKDMEEFTLNEDVEQSDICLDGSECCESAHDEKSVPKNCNKSEEVKQVVFGKTTGDDQESKVHDNERDREEAKPSTSLDKEVSTPKAKPHSWAALFKSGSGLPAASTSVTVSVNYPAEQVKESTTEENQFLPDQSSKIVPIEKDQGALALADFLQKSSLHPGTAALQLRGLINNGNWCYINATLQSLLGCPSFYCLFKAMNSIKQNGYKPSSIPLTDTMMDFANEFSTLDLKGLINKGKKTDDLRLGTSFEPKNVYEILSVLKSTLSETGKQQDAEEFLTFLLNGLHEEFLSLGKLIENGGQSNHIMNANVADKSLVNGDIQDSHSVNVEEVVSNSVDETDAEWERVGRNNKSANLRKVSSDETFITRLFGGVLRSSVHHAGAKESAMLQPFFTIQLDIQADNIWNIKEAFENYFTRESIEGFTSSKTNSKVEASHKTSLEKLPQVLILHLKYFVYDKTGGCQKTHKHVEISKELEIPKDVLSSNLKGRVPTSQRTYELFAVEFHLGKHAAGGHYTTAVKHKDPIGWVYCNDSIIQKTQFNQITKQQKDKVPYLLFYERVGHFGK